MIQRRTGLIIGAIVLSITLGVLVGLLVYTVRVQQSHRTTDMTNPPGPGITGTTDTSIPLIGAVDTSSGSGLGTTSSTAPDTSAVMPIDESTGHTTASVTTTGTATAMRTGTARTTGRSSAEATTTPTTTQAGSATADGRCEALGAASESADGVTLYCQHDLDDGSLRWRAVESGGGCLRQGTTGTAADGHDYTCTLGSDELNHWQPTRHAG